MATQLAGTRQPFAPLNDSRLQKLGSFSNRQNALSSSMKRKAQIFEDDNSENVDPVALLSPKRPKCPTLSTKDTSFVKTSNFFLTKETPSLSHLSLRKSISPYRSSQNISSVPRLDASSQGSVTVPAGRSPPRKRIGVTNNRKTAYPFTRIDPPELSTASTLGLSIEAALSGTIPSYRRSGPAPIDQKNNAHVISRLHQSASKESWFFDIHEDTEEELATNLMEHGACTLDISSDEESAQREGYLRGKENVPPPDDVSQSQTQILGIERVEAEMKVIKARVGPSANNLDESSIDLDRSPLGDLSPKDYYADGCDDKSVFIIPPEETEQLSSEVHGSATVDFVAQAEKEIHTEVNVLMQIDDQEAARKAALLQPIEKPEEGFELWESSSAKGE